MILSVRKSSVSEPEKPKVEDRIEFFLDELPEGGGVALRVTNLDKSGRGSYTTLFWVHSDGTIKRTGPLSKDFYPFETASDGCLIIRH